MTVDAQAVGAAFLALDSGRIDVWCTFVDDVTDPALV